MIPPNIFLKQSGKSNLTYLLDFSLARLVMEKTPHVMFAGAGAEKFAKDQGVPSLPKGSLVSKYALKALEEFKNKGGDNRTEIGQKVSKRIK